MEAVTTGALDYSAAQPNQKLWQIRRTLVTDYLGRRRRAYERAADMLSSVVQLTIPNITESSYTGLQKRTRRNYFQLLDFLWPWEDNDPDRLEAKMAAKLRENYAAKWGDPSDPATQARIEAVAEFLNNKAKQGVTNSDLRGANVYNAKTAAILDQMKATKDELGVQ